jgi:hypothetical protein
MRIKLVEWRDLLGIGRSSLAAANRLLYYYFDGEGVANRRLRCSGAADVLCESRNLTRL